MDPTTLRLIQGAAGAAGDATYVDDVFSTFLYDGNGSTKTIPNGIDLAGEGGLVWTKNRTSATFADHIWVDSERGNFYLKSNNTDPNNGIASFNFASTGYTVPANSRVNSSSVDYASWSFRKAPGFFDVVTYTGTGSNRTVAHNLKSTPGMMIVKCTNTGGTNWLVYHTSLGPTKAEILDLTTGPVGPSANYWNNTAPTSTEFTVGISNDVNTDGDTYIAYLFANDEPVFGTNEDESIIKCGSFTTNASGTLDAPVDLGFEPQFVLTKNNGGQWYLFDTMRGLGGPESNPTTLKPNSTDSEQWRTAGSFAITTTGFDIPVFALFSGDVTVPYMAIRRPNKPPSAATDVFSATAYTGNETERVISNNLCDFAILSDLTATDTSWSSWAQYVFTRLLGPNLTLATSNLNAAAAGWAGADPNGDYFQFDQNNGLTIGAVPNYMNNSGTDYVLYNFTRAPGFADVATYTGDGASSRNVPHNLGSAPELIIVKRVDSTGTWVVWSDELSSGYILQLNGRDAEINVGFPSNYINSSTSTTFNIGSDSDVNANSNSYIAYLFGTLPGISKVGKYLGTGNDINVDCGFSSGARFILIRRFSPQSTLSDWYVYDTSRGIVGGNDPYLFLNTDAAEVTNTDYIDPLASGFTVTSSAPNALNADGGTYLFLAIA